jgi:hypothetical protein
MALSRAACVLSSVLGTAALTSPVRAAVVDEVVGANALSDEDPSQISGFGLDLTISDGSGLNFVGQNYRNHLGLKVEPHWNVGRRFFASSPIWKSLTLKAEATATRALAGTDSASFSGSVATEPVRPCADLRPSQSGTIDPTSVPRCHPAPAERRTDFSDISLGAVLPRFARIPELGVDASASLRVVLPVSLQSRFQTLRLSTGVGASLGRLLWQDRVRLGYSFVFSKNFHEYTTPGLAPEMFAAAELGGNPYAGLAGVGISNFYSDPTRIEGGGFNISAALANGLSAIIQLSQRWSGGVAYTWIDGFTYSHRCLVEISGQTVDTCAAGDAVAEDSGSSLRRPGHRKSQLFRVSASYAARNWLELSLSWLTRSPRLKPDSSYRQGFVSVDYNAFTTVVLAVTVSVDRVAGPWWRSRGSR